MVFASFAFLFGFLPLFLVGYFLLPGRSLSTRNLFLTLSSYAFYAWWRVDFVALMLFSTGVDYWCGRAMAVRDKAARRPWLLLSLCVNLGLLAWFKYANLAVDTFFGLTGVVFAWQDVVLPIGISFYTFQSMSYSIDVYRGAVSPVRSFGDLACYVSMFPQLIAGPIVRYRDVAEQLAHREHTPALFATGTLLFSLGFVKKVLFADNAALLVDPAFAASDPTFAMAWLGLVAYAAQIYFDFSGYSDMAIGLGLMIGFRLPINFDQPYRAESVTEFWRRWHISLSTWLRDYLYVPLGGNRLGPERTYANLMLTMLLGGLWHGAAWTFVLWGAFHGAWLAIERRAGRAGLWCGTPRAVRIAATFLVVTIGWLPFRADGMAGLSTFAAGLVGAHGAGAVVELDPLGLLALAVGLLVIFAAPKSRELAARQDAATVLCIGGAMVVALAQLASREHTPFLYFQF